jgi:hypothetical protein
MKHFTEKEIAWLVSQLSARGDMLLEIKVLTEEPTREKFFAMLPDLDWEVKGGTADEPRWAYEEHPWYEALGITQEECQRFWDERNARG